MREHDCLGAAMRRAGEQPECPALMPGFKGLIIRTPRGAPTVGKDGPDLAGLGARGRGRDELYRVILTVPSGPERLEAEFPIVSQVPLGLCSSLPRVSGVMAA
jgi:hypothetical protein